MSRSSTDIIASIAVHIAITGVAVLVAHIVVPLGNLEVTVVLVDEEFCVVRFRAVAPDILKVVIATKRGVTDRLDRGWQMHIGETTGAEVGVRSDGLDAIRNDQFGQTAMGEREFVDDLHLGRNIDRGQRGALVEHIAVDDLQIRRQFDKLQIRAVAERIAGDGLHRIRNLHRHQRIVITASVVRNRNHRQVVDLARDHQTVGGTAEFVDLDTALNDLAVEPVSTGIAADVTIGIVLVIIGMSRSGTHPIATIAVRVTISGIGVVEAGIVVPFGSGQVTVAFTHRHIGHRRFGTVIPHGVQL